MNQIKIGKFISEQRKKKNLTQLDLAEKLNITDRAISKWENGRTMPDSGLMLDLCSILGISVNELLSGESIKMNNYNEKLENNLIEMVKEKEKVDKKMLNLELTIGYMSSIIFMVLIFVASFINMQAWVRILLIVIGLVIFVIGVLNCIKIEQEAGYYECQRCHHKYIPTYFSVLFSMHVNRTRYMKCPKCRQKSWQKKVIEK